MRNVSRRRAVTATLTVTAAVLVVAAVMVGAPQRAAEAAQEKARQEWLARDWTPTTAPTTAVTVPVTVPAATPVTAPAAPVTAPPAATVTTAPPAPLPAAMSGDVIGTLRVAAAEIDLTIIEGSGNVDDGLPARHTESVTLESGSGNTVLAGHRTGHGGPFRHLDNIQVGDPIVTQDRTGRYITWEVTAIQVLPEADTSPLMQTGDRTLTLYACADANGHPGSTSHRIVITARPQPLIPHPRAGAAAS